MAIGSLVATLPRRSIFDEANTALRRQNNLFPAMTATSRASSRQITLMGLPSNTRFTVTINGHTVVVMTKSDGSLKLMVKAGQTVELNGTANNRPLRITIEQVGMGEGREKISLLYGNRGIKVGGTFAPMPLPNRVQRWSGKDAEGNVHLRLRMPTEIDKAHAGKGPWGSYQGYFDKETNHWVQPYPPAGTNSRDIVAVLGDSISDQARLPHLSWSTQLARLMPGKTIWVAARGGQRSSGRDGIQPVPPSGGDTDSLLTALLSRKPGTIILELGMNDFHKGRSAAQFKASMMKIIERIRRESPGTKIILMGIRNTYPAPSPKNVAQYQNYLKRVEEYKAVFTELGVNVRRHGGVYIPDMYHGLKNDKGQLSNEYRSRSYDPIHPSQDAGYLMAVRVRKSMLKTRKK